MHLSGMVLAAAVVRAPTDAAGDAPAADTPPRERGGGSSGGETGLVQLHPNIGELKKHPEVIKRILEQAPLYSRLCSCWMSRLMERWPLREHCRADRWEHCHGRNPSA